MNNEQEKIKSFLIEKSDEINNFTDCDVIQEARNDVKDSKTAEELKDKAEYLLSAVAFRIGQEDKRFKYMRSIVDEIMPVKKYQKIRIKEYPYFYITDGKGLIYCQPNNDGTYHITSVHKPSMKVGTGYMLNEYATLDKKTVDNALNVFMPNWADRSDSQHVKKYETIEQFINYEKQFWGDDIKIENITLN